LISVFYVSIQGFETARSAPNGSDDGDDGDDKDEEEQELIETADTSEYSYMGEWVCIVEYLAAWIFANCSYVSKGWPTRSNRTRN
jgi:hypothetical protein